MKKQPFPTYENSPVECAPNAEVIVLDEALHTHLTSAYPELSSSKPKVTSQPETGPSLLLSDPSIPQSIYDSCSKSTTTQPSYTSKGTPSGRPSTAYDGPLGKLSPLTGLPYQAMTEHRHGALDKQIGGTHYKDFPIQPIEFIHKNGIGFIAGNVVKYVCRYRAKGGTTDLLKAKHYIEMLIEQERQTHDTTME